MFNSKNVFKKRYYFQYWIRTITIFISIIALGAIPSYTLYIQTDSVIVIYVFLAIWYILINLLFTRIILPKLWRYKVILNEDQFDALGGKRFIPPPNTFKNIFKDDGEREFEYNISQYNGFRIIKWHNRPPYIVYFLKKSDAILFKLVL